jgi:hypothetical protein
MLGRCQARFQNRDQPPPIFDKKRIGVEPQAWEDLGSMNSIRSGRPILEAITAADEPINLMRVERDDHILSHFGRS